MPPSVPVIPLSSSCAPPAAQPPSLHSLHSTATRLRLGTQEPKGAAPVPPALPHATPQATHSGRSGGTRSASTAGTGSPPKARVGPARAAIHRGHPDPLEPNGHQGRYAGDAYHACRTRQRCPPTPTDHTTLSPGTASPPTLERATADAVRGTVEPKGATPPPQATFRLASPPPRPLTPPPCRSGAPLTNPRTQGRGTPGDTPTRRPRTNHPGDTPAPRRHRTTIDAGTPPPRSTHHPSTPCGDPLHPACGQEPTANAGNLSTPAFPQPKIQGGDPLHPASG